jgi:hypothetical protein
MFRLVAYDTLLCDPHCLGPHCWRHLQATEFNYFDDLWDTQQELYKVFSQEAMVGAGQCVRTQALQASTESSEHGVWCACVHAMLCSDTRSTSAMCGGSTWKAHLGHAALLCAAVCLQGVRACGAAAANLCHLAAGKPQL